MASSEDRNIRNACKTSQSQMETMARSSWHRTSDSQLTNPLRNGPFHLYRGNYPGRVQANLPVASEMCTTVCLTGSHLQTTSPRVRCHFPFPDTRPAPTPEPSRATNPFLPGHHRATQR